MRFLPVRFSCAIKVLSRVAARVSESKEYLRRLWQRIVERRLRPSGAVSGLLAHAGGDAFPLNLWLFNDLHLIADQQAGVFVDENGKFLPPT